MAMTMRETPAATNDGQEAPPTPTPLLLNNPALLLLSTALSLPTRASQPAYKLCQNRLPKR